MTDLVATAVRRQRQVVYAGFLVVVVASLAAALLVSDLVTGPLLRTGVFAAVAFGLMNVPVTGVVRSVDRVELATDRTPETVRRELLGPDSPLFHPDYHRADRVDPHPETWTDRLLVDGDEVTYAVHEVRRDRLEVTVTREGSPVATADVAVDARDGRTVVDARIHREERVGLLTLATGPVRVRYERRALAALGYEVLEHRSRLRL